MRRTVIFQEILDVWKWVNFYVLAASALLVNFVYQWFKVMQKVMVNPEASIVLDEKCQYEVAICLRTVRTFSANQKLQNSVSASTPYDVEVGSCSHGEVWKSPCGPTVLGRSFNLPTCPAVFEWDERLVMNQTITHWPHGL